MGIQSSINSLLSQTQRLATFYTGLDKAKQIIGDTTAAKGEAQIQTDIAAGNAPMKDGKVDPEWLQKRRATFDNGWLTRNGELTGRGAMRAQRILFKMAQGERNSPEDQRFMNEPIVQSYIDSFSKSAAGKSMIAKALARGSVEARTDNLNQAKSDFNAHTASLIKEYVKGSGRP